MDVLIGGRITEKKVCDPRVIDFVNKKLEVYYIILKVTKIWNLLILIMSNQARISWLLF